MSVCFVQRDSPNDRAAVLTTNDHHRYVLVAFLKVCDGNIAERLEMRFEFLFAVGV